MENLPLLTILLYHFPAIEHLPLLPTLSYYLSDHPKIKNFEWNSATTIGASPTFVAAASAAYLFFTLLLSRYLTPSLPSSLLRVISVFHNLFLLILSVLMALGTAAASITSLPISHLVCFPATTPPKQGGPLYFWAHVFYLSKIYEFIDTLLIILNKSSRRRLSFLHVYHHAVVVIVSYVWLPTRMTIFPVAVTTNASVHVLMYAYYMLCAFGIRPRWKRVVTNVQILQFLITFLIVPPAMYLHYIKGRECLGAAAGLLTSVFNLSLLYLFVDFHRKNYAGSKTKKEAADKQA